MASNAGPAHSSNREPGLTYYEDGENRVGHIAHNTLLVKDLEEVEVILKALGK